MKGVLKKLTVFLLIVSIFTFIIFISTIMSIYQSVAGVAKSTRTNGIENVNMPITITGRIEETKVNLNITGSIEIKNIKGRVRDGNIIISSNSLKAEMPLPTSPEAVLNSFSWMPQFDQSLYSIHLDTSSPQFILNKKCQTDKNGFRKKNGAYLVALGSFYGGRNNIGELYSIKFKMANGKKKTVSAVLGDVKSDTQTDPLHQFHQKEDGTVLEFIMGTRSSQNSSIINNTFDEILSIKKVMEVKINGQVSGEIINITGSINGKIISASGTVKNGIISATGIYGYGNSMFIWPTTSTLITSVYGYRDANETNGIGSTAHGGIDIGVVIGSPIYASSSGRVTLAENYGGYGKTVIIKHSDRYITIYGHCNVLNVSEGDNVQQGQIIARSGNTGNSTGPHLHFEIRKDGKTIDPMKLLQKKEE